MISYKIKTKFVVPKIKKSNLFLLVKLINLSFNSGVKVRASLLVIALTLSTTLQFQLVEVNVLQYYLALFFFIISFLFYSSYQLVNINIALHEKFLSSISFRLCHRYQKSMKFLIFSLYLLSILLNYQALVLDIISL